MALAVAVAAASTGFRSDSEVYARVTALSTTTSFTSSPSRLPGSPALVGVSLIAALPEASGVSSVEFKAT
ncbi:MAG: hypothetical protein H0V10_11215, partial [Geodermatophilaceae bacterium]|nr:hypothetical protein [Geodermatophilaceae bacterium]